MLLLHSLIIAIALFFISFGMSVCVCVIVQSITCAGWDGFIFSVVASYETKKKC